MTSCPSCGSHRVFRSKTRSAFERFRRQFTMKRPYRCHACNWRGWAPDGMQAVSTGDVIDTPAEPPDLAAIDEALTDSPEPQRQTREKPEARSKSQSEPNNRLPASDNRSGPFGSLLLTPGLSYCFVASHLGLVPATMQGMAEAPKASDAVSLPVTGMTCAACAANIERALKTAPRR